MCPPAGIAVAAFGAPRGKPLDAATKAMRLRSSRRGNAADCPAPPEPAGRRHIANDLGVAPRVRWHHIETHRRAWTSSASRKRAAIVIPAGGH